MEKDQANAIKRIQKELSCLFFDEACEKFDKLVENLPLIQKEQTRIYLYSLYLDKDNIKDINRLPKKMLDFTTRIFPNISTMTPEQIEKQWNLFASPDYILLLNNIPIIRDHFQWFISLLKIKPNFASFSEAIESNIIPSYLVKYLPEFAWTVKNIRNPSSLPLC